MYLYYIISHAYIYIYICTYIWRIGKAQTTSIGNSFNYSKKSYWWLQGIHSEKKKRSKHHSLLCLLPTQRKPHFFYHCRSPQFVFSFANIKTIHKSVTMTHPSVDKSKFATHPKYIVILRRFSNRSTNDWNQNMHSMKNWF